MKMDDFAAEYPFEPHWFEIPGARMHYVDEGHGPVVLFVHGNPTWSFAWRRLIQALAPEYRCLAIDHVGCGRSEKPQDYPYTLDQHVANLVHLIDVLDLREITLVGHDWGGCIGMGAAVERPERFSRFVLMNTAAFRSEKIPFRIAVCRIPWLGAWGVRGLNLFSRAALSMAVSHRHNLTPAARAGYLAPYDSWANRIAVHRFVQDIPLRSSAPSYDRLVRIEQGLQQFQDRPMKLIWGEKDWCFTPEFRREFEQRFPKAESVVLSDAGHYLFEDAPAEVLAALQSFLEETSSQASREPRNQETI